MVPQTGGKSQSSLSSLASLAGVDLGMTESSELSPVIYPKIVNSIPFKLELMNTPVNFSKFDKPISLYDYYTRIQKPTILGTLKKYTIGLPGVILGAIRKKPQELPLPKGLTNGPIHLTRKQYLVKRALDQCISLEVEKSQANLEFIQERYNVAKAEAEGYQVNIAVNYCFIT